MALLQIAEPGQSAAPHQHRLAVGIDLGTTNSLVAAVRSGVTATLPDENGQHSLPSIVRYTHDGIEVGYVAALSSAQDPKNTIVPLAGQEVSPTSFAKVYWNQETHTVYVDGAGLPEPPEGYVYQVWALKLNPLTPLSIGLLDDFTGDNKRIFAVDNVVEAEAFGITLEPAGGSATPTLEQLYTLGKV